MEVDESSTGFNGYPHTVAKDEWLYVSGVNVTDDHHAVVSFTGGVIRKLDCVIGEGSPSWDSSPLWITVGAVRAIFGDRVEFLKRK